jgi:Secretion system C-terminal sorting domain/CARDB
MLSLRRIAPAGNWRRPAMLLGLLALTSTAATAQSLNYGPATAQTAAGTYTDLGTTGTVIATANNDDANSGAQSIGFSFSYNGQSFSQFILNTNGALKLGATAPSTAALYATNPQDAVTTGPIVSPDANDINLLLPFNHDLEAGTGGAEYRVATTGTTPNRVCTIQWKNVSDKTSGTITKQYGNFSFQVKLYETTNNIEFVYGTATAAAGTTDNFKHVTVGLKGSGGAQGQVVLATKASVSLWSTTTFLDALYTGNAFNVRSSVLPDPGRTLRFSQLFANDAEVSLIYSLTKMPLTGGGPHTIQAVVRNVGTAAVTVLPVTLRITGANTFTSNKAIASLPVGGSATVTFDPFTPSAAGNNTVTVSVLADNNANNDSKAQALQVTDAFSYANGTGTTGSVGINANNATGAFLSKFTTSASRTVTGANIFLSSSTTPANTSVGRTVYAVVLNSAGTLVGRSADYVIQTADVNAYKSFTLTTPATVAAGDFYVGIGVVNPTGSVIFYPASFQTENPTRAGAFYIAAPLNATGTNAVTDIASQNFGILMLEATLSTTTAVSKELMNSVSLYPNPSVGEITLDIQGAKAQNGLQVEVSNLLGQRVYTGSARDNFRNKLNLSHLSNGLYTVKVSNGNEYMMRTITINK